MLLMAEDIPIVEIPRPQEDSERAEETARFILKNLYRLANPSAQRLEYQLADLRERTTIAAFDDGLIVATGSLEISLPGQAKLEDIAVLDKEGYRRIGLGSKIVRMLEEVAVDAEAEEIRFTSSITAIAFYEKLGYTVDEAEVLCMKTLVRTAGEGATAGV